MDISRITWRKSSRSTGNGGECVEVGAWRKSSQSGQEGHCVEISSRWTKSSHSIQQGNCVEVAADETAVLARDSKDPDGPVLGFGAEAWHAFLTTAKTGHLDLG